MLLDPGIIDERRGRCGGPVCEGELNSATESMLIPDSQMRRAQGKNTCFRGLRWRFCVIGGCCWLCSGFLMRLGTVGFCLMRESIGTVLGRYMRRRRTRRSGEAVLVRAGVSRLVTGCHV